MRRRTWLLAGGGVAVAGSVALLAAGGSPDAPWAVAEKGTLVMEVEVTGELEAVETSKLSAPPIEDMWDFKISMLAPEGKAVKAGTPVLGFDAAELERKLLEKQAEADSARKKIEKRRADSDLARKADALRLAEAEAKERRARLKVDVPPALQAEKELFDAKLELEEAVREIAYTKERMEASARADAVALGALGSELAAADRRVREIQEAIESMNVKAPRDGTVVYVANWRDEKKKVGDSTYKGEGVVEIPNLTAMKAQGEVDEADAGRLAKGQRVSLRLDAHPDVEFTGTIASVWSTVQRKSWRDPQKVVRVDVDLDRTDTERMRPGMRFRGRVEIERVEDVLRVPADAVFPGAEGPVVFRKSFGGFDTVSVEVGRRNAESVEIVKGLEAGEKIARKNLARAGREGA